MTDILHFLQKKLPGLGDVLSQLGDIHPTDQLRYFRELQHHLNLQSEHLEQMVCLYIGGRHSFRLSPALGNMLLHTDSTNTPGHAFRLPYKTFAVEVNGRSFKDIDVEGIPIFEINKSVPDHYVIVNQEDDHVDKKGVNYMVLCFTQILKTKNPDGGVPMTYLYRATIPYSYLEDETPISLENTTDKQGGTMIRLVLNTILYINSTKADAEVLKNKIPKPVPRSFKRKRKLRTKTAPVITLLGGKMAAMPYDKNKESTPSNARKHLRRGHWKGVWVGTKKDPDGTKRLGEKVKSVWILPTWVNKDNENTVPYTIRNVV
jgi:hypothetical protein